MSDSQQRDSHLNGGRHMQRQAHPGIDAELSNLDLSRYLKKRQAYIKPQLFTRILSKSPLHFSFPRKFLTLWKDADPGLLEVKEAKKKLAGLKSQ